MKFFKKQIESDFDVNQQNLKMEQVHAKTKVALKKAIFGAKNV